MDAPLLADQRRALIRAQVAREGAVRVADLTESLGVSEMTVRRDIAALADEGVLARVHGGAVATRTAAEPAFAEKAERSFAEKAAIAQAVAALIEPGTSLGITAGTTTAAAARAIAALPHVATLSVLTNSLPATEALLAADPRPALTVTGGEPTPSAALVGPLAEAACRDFHLDVLVLGVSGMSLAAGLTSPNTLEVATLQAFVAAAGRVVVAADSAKWGTAALRTIARWDAVDVLVTDDALPADAIEALGGVEVRTVSAHP
ncbi:MULTISPECIES: DeoR/GlpR family DNA-binding transcription regulator [Miniimonas]|uniref:DeoR/GlpR family DNA-binding transcription regulator n=1 Tax=Miniimonas TaxID=947525 RepID=UPI001F2F42B3|nr:MULTISPECIES: DeoR/GlpR family DNA-binding transcription regulator [Miniimonas]